MAILISSTRTAELAGQTDNPFIAYSNLAASGVTYGGASALPGGPVANAFTGTTFDWWLPDVVGTGAGLWVIFPTAVTVPFVGIAAHNISTLGATVSIQRSTNGGGSWVDAGAGTHTPTDNSPIGFRMRTTGADATHWRVWVTGLTTGAPLGLGVVHMGPELVMPSRFYDGFAPVITPTEVELQANLSEGGHFLGQSVKSKGSTFPAEFKHLDPIFVRGAFKGFQTAFNEGAPFFFGWRPATWPADIHYCQRAGDPIRPINAGGLDLMSVSFSARAFEAR